MANGGSWSATLYIYKNINNDSFIQLGSYKPNKIHRVGVHSVNKNTITIIGSNYKDEDPMCCPSIHKLIEISLNEFGSVDEKVIKEFEDNLE